MDNYFHRRCLCGLCAGRGERLDSQRRFYLGGWEMAFEAGSPVECHNQADSAKLSFTEGGLVVTPMAAEPYFIPWHELDRIRHVLETKGKV